MLDCIASSMEHEMHIPAKTDNLPQLACFWYNALVSEHQQLSLQASRVVLATKIGRRQLCSIDCGETKQEGNSKTQAMVVLGQLQREAQAHLLSSRSLLLQQLLLSGLLVGLGSRRGMS